MPRGDRPMGRNRPAEGLAASYCDRVASPSAMRFLPFEGRRVAYATNGSGTELSLDADVALLRAVVDELGEQKVSLIGGSSGGCAAIAFAARYPERVERLLLYGAYADGSSIATAGVRDAIVGAVRSHWGLG